MLAWLLAATGLASVVLLLVALAAAGRSTQAFQDVNLSGSMRYRSLWMYGATRTGADLSKDAGLSEDASLPKHSGWPGQAAAMQSIRVRLARRYPSAVRASDPIWDTFLGSLQRTGQVDWQTANAMRNASNTVTGQIQKEASARNVCASLLLRLGVAGLLAALAASILLLFGLRNVEVERQTVEEQLQRERDFQNAMLESLQAGIVACGADGTLALFNRAAREFHGLPPEPLPPEQWAERFSLFQPDGVTPLEMHDVPLLRAFRGEVVRDAEMVIAPNDAPSLVILASGQAIYSSSGEKLGAVVAMHDVTARRRIEQELSRLASIVQSSEEAILAMTLDGTLVSWNAGAERLYGYSEGEVVGRHASVLVPAGEESIVESVIPRLMRGESLAPIEVVRHHRSGAVLSLALTFSPLHSPAGQIIGVSCIARNITARRQAEDALRESEARLRYLSDAAFEGIAVSQNGVVLDANPAFLDFYGYTCEEVVGMAGTEFAAPESQDLVSAKVIAGEETAYEAVCRRKDGSTFLAELRGRSALWNGLPARVTAVRDITERKALEDAMRRSEEALRAMLGGAPVILYAADAQGIITLSEGTGLAALGQTPGEAVGRSVFEFMEGCTEAAENTRRALAGEAVSYDLRHGVLCFHVELTPQRSAEGVVTGIIGVSFDITERAHSEERFRVLFEQSSDAHLLFDDGGIIDCNAAAVSLLGAAGKSEMLALHPAVLSPEWQPDGQRSDVKCQVMDAAAYKFGYHRFEWMHRTRDGIDLLVEVTLTPVILQGKPVMLTVWHDLTERKRAEQQIKDYMVVLEFQKSQLEESNRELEALATTDGLTGLKNRRTFGAKLTEEHARAVRYHQPLSLLLLDVDQFKTFNDTFGHLAGDAVLQRVAEALTHTARDTDITARYGGEEFAVILPQTDEAGAMAIAERVHASIVGSEWERRPITVSAGVCTLSLDTPTPESMIACADRALYHSKEAGRNQATHGNPAAPLVVCPKAGASAPPAVRAPRRPCRAANTPAHSERPK